MPTVRANTGAVATSNYEARKLKIRSGMSLSLAKKLSNEDTVFIKADKEYYQEISKKVFEVVDFFCEKVEQVSVDEAYLDLSNPNGFEDATEKCRKIKEKIRNEIGLTCSIGLSVNKLIAKMASEENKPDGLTIIKENEINSFISKKKVSALHGLGPKSEKKLMEKGVITISDLQKVSLQELIKLFGKAKGEMFYNFSRGIDNREINSNREKQQLSRMITLKKDTNNFEEIKESVFLLSELVFKEAKKINKNFKTCSIIIITNKFETITKSKTLDEPILNVEELKNIELELLQNYLNESLSQIRRIGVRVSNFGGEFGFQKKLFDFGK